MAGEELRQTGRVVELKGKLAVVRFQRSDACGHCNAYPHTCEAMVQGHHDYTRPSADY